MNVIYRKASPEDACGMLAHLSAVGGETDNLSYGKDTFNISAEREARFIERFSKSRDDIMLVAADGDKILGNAIVERNRIERYHHRAEISITVLKDYWGRGIGSRLMEMIIEFSKSVGIEILYLEVRSDNEKPISLYKKFGFKKIGSHDSFFKIEDEYVSFDYMYLTL